MLAAQTAAGGCDLRSHTGDVIQDERWSALLAIPTCITETEVPRILLTILAAAAVAACDGSTDPRMHDGMSGVTTDVDNIDGGGGSDGGQNQGGQDAGTDAGTVAPEAPSLSSVQVVVHGTMKLDWQNPAGGCGSIAISRRSTGAYSVVNTVSGSSTTANDSPGHLSGTYCYTLACERGTLQSPPSNERCASQ